MCPRCDGRNGARNAQRQGGRGKLRRRYFSPREGGAAIPISDLDFGARLVSAMSAEWPATVGWLDRLWPLGRLFPSCRRGISVIKQDEQTARDAVIAELSATRDGMTLQELTGYTAEHLARGGARSSSAVLVDVLAGLMREQKIKRERESGVYRLLDVRRGVLGAASHCSARMTGSSGRRGEAV